MSLIRHDGDYLDCGHYATDVFDSSIGILWHYDHANITEISDFPEVVYTRDSRKLTTTKQIISGSKDILFVVSIRKRHLIASGSVFFQELINMSKAFVI